MSPLRDAVLVSLSVVMVGVWAIIFIWANRLDHDFTEIRSRIDALERHFPKDGQCAFWDKDLNMVWGSCPPTSKPTGSQRYKR